MTTQLRSASFELTKILSPTLVMAGENDVIKLSHTQWIAQQIKNSQLVIIPKADHFFLVKNPNEFNKIIESFLKNH
ncbi:alpha/beta fold hydrolase [Desemzia incerta]